MKYCLLFIALLLLSTFQLQAQIPPKVDYKLGKSLRITAADSSAQMKLNVRFQSLFNSERSGPDGEWENSFLIRRARLKLGGWLLNPNVGYKVELALSNRDLGSKHDFGETSEAPKIVLDAVLKWKMNRTWSLWVGQTKLPGNRERVISSQALQMVDRSSVNSIFNIDREMGIHLRGKVKVGEGILRPIASWSFGEGRNITRTNIGGTHYVARLEWLPMGTFKSKGDYVGADVSREKTPKLALAGTYSQNNGAPRQKQSGRFLIDDEGNYLSNDLQTIFGDMMFKYQGFSVMAEYAHKIVSDKEVKDQEDLRLELLDANGRSYYTGEGINIQTGYLFKNNVEISARYTSVSPDTEVSFNGEKEYTLGLSKYFAGHALKLQGDVSLFNIEGQENNDLRYRLQMEVQF